ncbi:AAA family ATPase [Rhodospirillum centenum]|uniref:Probable ATPase n=1 Tax=Rhodospirillum centenum (strain ATCC 51521 / SW) TaxID=414684 RepID=B6IT60_RHOCS|nr:AAA family ATPase [Rhodospirillum centenum]ACI98818.1 probable ATPase [Rhodospirillum centenum SW]
MRSGSLAAAEPDETGPELDADAIFNGLLLALIGRRRLLTLVGETPGDRIALLARLARHVETDGSLVLTVGAGPGVTVEDLIEVAGRAVLDGRPPGEGQFDALVDLLETRLDQAGTGILMVEEAERLPPDTLRDLVELSGSMSTEGNFLQILLSGSPELEGRLHQADLMPVLRAVGTLYRMPPSRPDRSGTGMPPTTLRPSRRPAMEPPPRSAGSRGWFLLALLAAASAAGTWWLGGADRSLWTAPDRTAPPSIQTAEAPPSPEMPVSGPRRDGTGDDARTAGTAPVPPMDAPEPAGEPPPAESRPVTDAETAAPLQPPSPEPPAIDLPVRTPTAPPAPAAETQEEAARSETSLVGPLLERAQEQIAARHLTTPRGDNALDTLRAIMEVAPGHPAVAEMRQRIIATYRQWARLSEQRGDWDLARIYYQRALRVDPANRTVTQLLDSLGARRAGGRPVAAAAAGAADAPAASPPVRPATAESRPDPDDPPPPRLR